MLVITKKKSIRAYCKDIHYFTILVCSNSRPIRFSIFEMDSYNFVFKLQVEKVKVFAGKYPIAL